jgi:energy-coupling factor transporter ATP-binding protein EcfA2
MPWIEPLPEAQGTTVQVCGLWPFIAGSSDLPVGVPLGKNLLKGTVVCADPISWFLANLINQPSCFVLGRPGLGKSTLVRRIVTVLEAWGHIPMVLSDTKPDYVDLIDAQGGQVFRLGPGQETINILDFSELLRELANIPDDAVRGDAPRREAIDAMKRRRSTLVTGLLELGRDARISEKERSLVVEGLRILDDEFDVEKEGRQPRISDLVRVVRDRHPRLAAIAQDRGDADRYAERTELLVDGLIALTASGVYGSIFDGDSTVQIEAGRPVVFDLSSIDDGDLTLQAAVQAVTWSFGSAVVDAEKYLADAKLRPRRHYFLVMDELWRMLRASSAMVFFVDALTRLNRARGIAQAMITHTMDDLKLSSDELTTIAWGFVARSAMVFIGGLAQSEMGNLEQVFAMSAREKAMIMDWSADGSLNPHTGQQAIPPGRGKFLLKIGKKPGTPFELELTAAEMDVNNTNRAWTDAAERFRQNAVRVTEALEEAA